MGNPLYERHEEPASNCGCPKGPGIVGRHGWHWIALPAEHPQQWTALERCPAYAAAVARNRRAA